MATRSTPKAAACDQSAAKRLIRDILSLETGGTISQSRLFTLAYYADCALALETGKRTDVWRRGNLSPLCEEAERAVAMLAASGELNRHALSLHPENALLVFNEIHSDGDEPAQRATRFAFRAERSPACEHLWKPLPPGSLLPCLERKAGTTLADALKAMLAGNLRRTNPETAKPPLYSSPS